MTIAKPIKHYTSLPLGRITMNVADVILTGETSEEKRAASEITTFQKLRDQRRPIGITKSRRLLFGLDRLRHAIAGKQPTIEAWVVPIDQLMQNLAYPDSKELLDSERAEIGAAVRRLLRSGGDINSRIKSMRNDEFAGSCAGNWTRNKFAAYTRVLDKGVPELVVAVDTGKIVHGTGRVISRNTPKQQLEILSGKKEYKPYEGNYRGRADVRRKRNLPMPDAITEVMLSIDSLKLLIKATNGKLSNEREIDVDANIKRLNLARNLITQVEKHVL